MGKTKPADPREWADDYSWWQSFKIISPLRQRERAYDDICARLNAKDAEIAALKAEAERLRLLLTKTLASATGAGFDRIASEAAPSGGEGG